MTQDEIIDKYEILKMAKEAGAIPIHKKPKDVALVGMENINAFAKLVADKEREACAMVAQKTVCDTHIPTGVRIYGTAAAKAIRARGEAT